MDMERIDHVHNVSSDVSETSSSVHGMSVLPPEAVRAILVALGNADFGACMRASRVFHVHTWADYIERRYGSMTQPLLVECAPLEAIEFLHARGRFHPTVEDIAHAARNRRADLFSWLDAHRKYRTCACPVRRGLAQGGDVEFARRFFEDADLNTLLYSMKMAAGKGHTDMVAWFVERTAATPEELAAAAGEALRGWHVETAEWILDRTGSGWGWDGPLRDAMKKVGPDVVVRWVTDRGYERHVTAYDLFDGDSESTYHAHILDWKASIAGRHDWSSRSLDDAHIVHRLSAEAVLCGRLDVLRDVEARMPGSLSCLSRGLSRLAAMHGHWDIVESVLGDGPHMTTLAGAMTGAIVGGQWHVFDALMARYATVLAKSAQLLESVMSQSAHVGIDALARVSAAFDDRGSALFADSTWTAQAIANVACEDGSLDVIEHLCERHGTTVGIPSNPNAVDEAAARGDLVMLRWLHERLGWNSGEMALQWAVSLGHVDVVRYLCTRGMASPGQLGSQDVLHAAKKGHIGVFKILHDNGLDAPSLDGLLCDAVKGAIQGHQADLVAWLCDTYPRVREWALMNAQASKCLRDCGSPVLMFSDVDLDWMRVMRQYATHEGQ